MPIFLRQNNPQSLLSIALVTVLLSGCRYFKPTEIPPKTIQIPKQWDKSQGFRKNLIRPWLNEFSDPQLTLLIKEAFRQNPNLQGLIAGVAISDDQTWFAISSFLPKIDAGLRASRNKRSNAGGFSVSSPRSNNVGFSLDFLWEIDLWYKLGNELAATEHEKTASESDLYAAQLSLAANITKTWFDAIVSAQQVKLADKTIASFENALEIVDQGYNRGLYKALDVRLARSNLLNAKGKKENFLRIKDGQTRTLEAMLGRYPSAQLTFPDQLPTVTNELPSSVPASLLERRPDIIAAAERFFATDQRMIKARKNMLPTIQLSGGGGTSTKRLDEIFDPERLIWNIASGLSQPLFQGGQLIIERSQAETRVKQAAAHYAQVVLQAFQEVETTMAAEQWLHNQQQFLIAEAKEAKEAERLAEDDYMAGLTDIITLLDAQRRAFDAENSLLDMGKQYLQNRVNLYLALGGPVLNPDSK